VQQSDERPGHHILGDLGLVIRAEDDVLHGTAEVVPAMFVPGTTVLRASLLATWADILLGLVTVRALAPRIPVTLELDVHVFEEIDEWDSVCCIARLTKAGQSVIVSTIDFTDGNGRPLGFGHSLFMAAPDPKLSMPAGDWALNRFGARRGALLEPFAVRAGCERLSTGVASLPCQPHVLNGAKTLNGGLVSLVVEEAVLSAHSVGTVASMSLRYLRPVRGGPAVARAEIRGGLGSIEVRDASTDALAVLATTRSFGA
jgi:acyl-coenzyme A thioesterase PaaI-like protein